MFSSSSEKRNTTPPRLPPWRFKSEVDFIYCSESQALINKKPIMLTSKGYLNPTLMHSPEWLAVSLLEAAVRTDFGRLISRLRENR